MFFMLKEKNIITRYDQQIRVMRRMLDAYSYDQIMTYESGLRNYMLHCLGAIMMNTIMFCCSGGDAPERKQAYQELWDHIKENDPKLYKYLRTKGSFCLFGYRVLCKMIKLG